MPIAVGRVFGGAMLHATAADRSGVTGTRDHFLVPLRETCSDVTNSYWRVAQWEPGTKTALILPLAESANFDSCRGFGARVFTDINGDGMPDLLGG